MAEKRIMLPLFVLIALFGMGSWLGVNGIWMELPLTISSLPEAWSLPSYLAVTFQVANIAPILLTMLSTWKPGKVPERPIIQLILAVQIMVMLLLSFFWHRTSIIGGVSHSSALLSLSFFLALCNTTSNIVFLPYMAIFPGQYMTALFVGMGLSALVPSLITLVQGVGGSTVCVNTTVVDVVNDTFNRSEVVLLPVGSPPVFSVAVFYGLMTVLMCISAVAFGLLLVLPFVKKHHVKQLHSLASYSQPEDTKQPLKDQNGIDSSCESDIPKHVDERSRLSLTPQQQQSKKMPTLTFTWLLLLEALICALAHSVLPSIQAYSCLPYGKRALHLSICLSNIANPISCFIPLFISTNDLKWLSAKSLLGTGFAAYIVFLALASPTPPFQDSALGEVLVVGLKN